MKNIVLANGKGGVGKSTLAVLLVEWLNHKNIPVGIFDGDTNQTFQMWANYCQEEGRTVTVPKAQAVITVIDTAGAGGSAVMWIQKADIIVCPFKANFADLDITVSWFRSLNLELQKKVHFVPNMLGVASEQKNGVEYVKKLIEEVGAGHLLDEHFLKNRDAIYPDLFRGAAANFFDMGPRFDAAQKEAAAIAKNIFEKAGVMQ